MKIFTVGNASVISIALVGVGVGLWSRFNRSSSDIEPRKEGTVVSFVSTSSPDQLHGALNWSELSEQPTSAKSVEPSVVNEVSHSDLRSVRRYQPLEMLPGIAHPLHVAEISAAADGPLWKLFVAEGDIVAADQVMALIDNRVAFASVTAAKSTADRQAMLEAARAKVALAEQYLSRIQQAASKNAASGLEVDEAGSRLAEAKAALQEGTESQRDAVARLEVEKARLETHEIRAPFPGTVIKIYPHLGETVSRGAPIVKVADVTRLRAELHVPLSLADSMKTGGQLDLEVDLPGQPSLKAMIVFIAPLVDAATQTIRVVVEIDNTDKQLPAGFAVRLSAVENDTATY